MYHFIKTSSFFFFNHVFAKLEEWWIRGLCLLSNCLPNLIRSWMEINRFECVQTDKNTTNFQFQRACWIICWLWDESHSKNIYPSFFSFLAFMIDFWLTFHFLQINGNDKWTTIMKCGAKFLLIIWNHLNNSQQNNLFGLKCMRYFGRNLF